MADNPTPTPTSPEDPSRAAALPVEDFRADGVQPAADAAQPIAQPEFAPPPSVAPAQLELLDDVELDVKIELGRASLCIDEVLRLGVGSVVELDKLAGDPVDVYINERLAARGEVLVLNDNLCVRVNDILSPIPDADHLR